MQISWRGIWLRVLFLVIVGSGIVSCDGDSDAPTSDNYPCSLPEPFCGGSFPLNTEPTTPYGPAWADVSLGSNGWATCFGPYALCYYANCTPNADGTADCPCYDTYGTNFVLINAILNLDAYQETKSFCDATPGACQVPNAAPVCDYINSGTFMSGANRFSTFSLYRASVEPIGSTSCTSQPGLYAGCMTAPCFGQAMPDPGNHTATLNCDCPTFNGPYQLGQSGLSCNDAPLAYSAAYNANGVPSDPCDLLPSCVPDAPPDNCGCPLYVPGTTVLPPNSGVDCNEVCEEYTSCKRDSIELGFTCDATICTTEERGLLLEACNGLQNCDLTEIFEAEMAAGCSCCGSQLCGCDANAATETRIAELDAAQRAAGDTPQCDINGTLCGAP